MSRLGRATHACGAAADVRLLPTGNLLAGQHDTQKSRHAPSKPTPVKFPSLQPPESSSTSPPPVWKEHKEGIPAQFLKLRKPTDVDGSTLASLNVTFQPECDFDTLLSSLSNNAQSHLPPKTWLEPPTQLEPAHTVSLLSNGRKVPDQKDFFVRARELTFTNGDAFSSLSRKGKVGQASLRLAHFRKFWEGLDNLAYYWDTSLDEYIPVLPEATELVKDPTLHCSRFDTVADNEGTLVRQDPVQGGGTLEPLEGEEPRKKAKTEAVSSESLAHSINSNGFSNNSTIVPSQVLPSRIAPPKSSKNMNEHNQTKTADLSDVSYRGYRIGNGAEMPDQYRIDCVQAFIEPIAWAFGVTLSPHRRPPILTLQHVRFPVRMSSVGWRGPQDRVKARQGWLEGPVLGIQCRADVDFGKSGNLEAESSLDAVRELGGLLLLAQERAREARLEKCAGEGKWWTTKQRWGGGPGGEVGLASEVTNVDAKSLTSRSEGSLSERNRDGSKVRRRPTATDVWRTLKAGSPLWDPKIAYEAIGKDKGVEWDDVRSSTTQGP